LYACTVGWESTYEHAAIIRRHYLYLVERLDVKLSGMLDHLLSEGVLREAEYQSISAEMTTATQVDWQFTVALPTYTDALLCPAVRALSDTAISQSVCRGLWHSSILVSSSFT